MDLLLTRTPLLRHRDGRTVPLAVFDAVLLAWLAIEGPTARDRLAVLLWPNAEGNAAHNNLRQRLFRLRREHGDGLLVGRVTLALAEGVAHDLDDAPTLLGDVAIEITGELAQWLAEQRRTRAASHAARLSQAADDAERRAEFDVALGHACALVELDATSESAHRRVMRLHYAAGDRAAALLAFDRCEATLKDEVGATPSTESLALLALIERSELAPTISGQPRPVPASVLRPPRIVGRDVEWQRLETAWREKRLASVVGDAGLGKTRLVGDFAAAHGRVLSAGARPGDERVVYASASRLLRQLPREWIDAMPRPVRAELARLLPELGDAAPVARAEDRTRFFNAVAAALDGGEAPFDAVVLDDLHFADEASVELLRYVAAGARRPWIVAARPAEVSAAGRGLLDDALDQESTRIDLAPLDVAQVEELLLSLDLDGLDAAAEAQALHARTGGNPLFLLETIKLGLAPLGGAQASAIPMRVAAVIDRRISRLSSAAIQLARCAAVATPDFSIELASRVLGLRTLELADPWAELEAAQVLRDGAFAHDLIYESALASVPGPVARQLHAEIAAFLGERGGEPARIAAHWIAAGQEASAIVALFAAAEAAWRALRLREQCDFLQQAADIATRLGRCDDAFRALHAWWHTMRIVDRTQIELAFHDRLDQSSTNPLQRTDAMLARALWLREAGSFVESARVSEAAAAIARAEKLPENEVKAVLYSAGCASFLGDADRAVRLLRSALPWILSEGPPEAQATYFNDLGCCLDHANEAVEAETFHRRALAVCHAMAWFDRAALAGANLAANRRSVGAMREALELLHDARRQALAYDASQGLGWPIDLHTFSVLRDLARYADALRAAELLLQSMGQNPSMVVAGHVDIACLWLHLGQPARAHQSLEATRGLQTMPFLQARRAQLEGRLAMAQGRPAGASLNIAMEGAATGGRGSLGLMIALDLALTQPRHIGLAAARDVLDRAVSRNLHGVALAARARVARLAASCGEHDLALRVAREALDTASDIEPDDLYRGEIWLAAAIAFEAAGDPRMARDTATAGVGWMHAVAADQVPAEFRHGFIERNPVNRDLRALHARLSRNASEHGGSR